MWSGFTKFIQYKDFKDRLTGADIDTRPAEEILAEVAEVEKWVNNGPV